MKPTDTITALFSHNLWANRTLLDRCAALTNEQLKATISGTFGSIYDTLLHIVTAEQSYFHASAQVNHAANLRMPDP